MSGRWQEALDLTTDSLVPHYMHCYPDELITFVVEKAAKGVADMECRLARPGTSDPVHLTPNEAWRNFWCDPASYHRWEARAVQELFSLCEDPQRRHVQSRQEAKSCSRRPDLSYPRMQGTRVCRIALTLLVDRLLHRGSADRAAKASDSSMEKTDPKVEAFIRNHWPTKAALSVWPAPSRPGRKRSRLLRLSKSSTPRASSGSQNIWASNI